MSETPNPYTVRVRRMARLRQAVGTALLIGAAAVGGVYWLRGRAQRRSERGRPEFNAPVLGLNVQQSAAGVTIAKSEGGRPLFRISAKSAEKVGPGSGREAGMDVLHGVRIQVFDRSGAAADDISGDAFGYDETSGDLMARGLVHVILQDRSGPVALEARDLDYNVKAGSGSIAQGVTFRLAGASGSAGTAQLDSRAGVALLGGGVHVLWRRPGRAELTVTSREATLLRGAAGATITLEGGAMVASGPQTLRADQLILSVAPDQTLRRVRAVGRVRAADALPGRTLRATADAADADVTREALSHLILRGRVQVAQASAAADSQLDARQVGFEFGRPGELRRVAASGGAELRLPAAAAGQPPQRLAAPEIDFDLTSSGAGARGLALSGVTTRGRSSLDRGPLHAEADAVRVALDARQQPASAHAQGDVRLRQRVAGGTRSSRSDSLDLVFEAGKLAQADESGRVALQQGDRKLWADDVQYTPATFTTLLTGHVRAEDPEARFTSARATYIDAPGRPGMVEAEGGVALSAEGTAGPMLASRQPVVITAAAMRWTGAPAAADRASAGAPVGLGGKAEFTGAVRLLQAPNLLRAQHLTLDAGARSLLASGDVTTNFENAGREIVIRAASLRYTDTARQAEYRDGVMMQSGDLRLVAPALDVLLANTGRPGLDRAQASGGVRVTQPGRTATAEQVSYQFVPGKVVLSGGGSHPLSILDAERGEIRGDPLTFWLANDEIQVGSKPGARAQGRVIGHK